MSLNSITPLPKRKKLSSPSQCHKKLSVLLSECNELQKSLAETWNALSKNNSTSMHIVKTIKYSLDNSQNIAFRHEFDKYKKMKHLKNYLNTTGVQKKISSILKPPRLADKFPLQRTFFKPLPLDSERIYVNNEEIKTNEAKVILENNRRNFGEHFPSEINLARRLQGKKVIKSLPVLPQRDQGIRIKSKKKALLKKDIGNVSQMIFPYVSNKTLKEEDKEIFRSMYNNVKEKYD